MSLQNKIELLLRAAAKLPAIQGKRVARLNARRKIAGLLKSIRHQLDVEYPAIAKPTKQKPPAPSKPEKPKNLRLPFRRAYDHETAVLFANLAGSILGYHQPIRISAEEGISLIDGTIQIIPSWPDRMKWMEIICDLAYLLGDQYQIGRWHGVNSMSYSHTPLRQKVVDLWQKFWSEQLPTADLRLAAQHQEFLEKRSRRP